MSSLSRSTAHFAAARPQKVRVFRWIDAVFRVHQDRVSLSEMPDHMRKDIGLSAREIDAEVKRPFWDIPDWWR